MASRWAAGSVGVVAGDGQAAAVCVDKVAKIGRQREESMASAAAATTRRWRWRWTGWRRSAATAWTSGLRSSSTRREGR
uniref:Uncharacterized protein n=1 Tax=Oryza rufipogon TaxID=4529 RepID=A0A0E0PHC0_ORYRU